MQSLWTLQDAKNKFSEVVNAARAGTPQVVSRRGKPAVVILSTEAYGRLLKQGDAAPTSFRDLLLAMPQNPEDEDECSTRMDVQPREVEF